MTESRFQITLKSITDRKTFSLLESLYEAKSRCADSSSRSNIDTTRKRTFILNQEEEVMREESMKMIIYTREVSFDTIQFILSILSCVFSLLIVYTSNIDSDFLYNSISISTLAIETTLICKYILAQKSFRIGQIVESIAYLIHPNLLFSVTQNGYLHIVMLCRLHIVLKYFLRNRVYLSIRADRVVDSNGSSSSGMIFALKAELMEMSSKGLLLIYAITMIMMSHCLYVVQNFQSPLTKSTAFVDCIFGVAETMTLIGFVDSFQSDAARVIAILCLILGQCLNSTMILINVKSLTMCRQEQNAHELFNCLIQRQQLQKSAVKLLQFNHKYKKDTTMNHPSQYHKIALQIRTNRKNLYKTTRGGVVENLSMTFMEGCYRLKQHTMLTYNYIDKIISTLKKSRHKPFKSVKFIEENKVQEEEKQPSSVEDSDENQFKIDNFEINRKYRRTIRRIVKE